MTALLDYIDFVLVIRYSDVWEAKTAACKNKLVTSFENECSCSLGDTTTWE